MPLAVLLLNSAARDGDQWYINQNQFFRQIRNFEFDLRDMPLKTDDADQALVPTGLHWQVAQATSLQNLKFTMPTGKGITHVGIFTENGSGGFVSGMPSPKWRVSRTNMVHRSSTESHQDFYISRLRLINTIT